MHLWFLLGVLFFFVCVAISCGETNGKMIQNRMKQVLLAIRNYSDVNGKMPPLSFLQDGADVTFSWRWAIRNYLDSPPRGAVQMSTFELISYYKAHPPFAFEEDRGKLVAIAGDGTAYAAMNSRLRDVPGDSILLLEVPMASASEKRGDWIGFTALDEAYSNNLSRKKYFTETKHHNSYCVGFSDGAVWELEAETPARVVEKFFLTISADERDRERDLAPHRIR
jgi:hypothetical protein